MLDDNWLRENIVAVKVVVYTLTGILIIFGMIIPFLRNFEILPSKRSRIKKFRNAGDKFYESSKESIEFFVNEQYTKTLSFGRKISWIAIRSNDHESIVRDFNKSGKKVFKTNLEYGLHGAYAGNTFIYPPINGWTLIIHPNYNSLDDTKFDYLKDLSNNYGEINFYGSFRGVLFTTWIKFENGQVIRSFCVADGEIYRNEGTMTEIEIEILNREIEHAHDIDILEIYKGEGKYLILNDEEHVLEIAGKWSINPDNLESMNIQLLGTIIEN